MRKILMVILPALLFAGEYTGKVTLNPGDLSLKVQGEYIIVDYPGAYHSGVPGSPSLPLISLQVLIPSGAEAMKVEVISLKTVRMKVPGRIIPNQKPVPLSRLETHEFTTPDDKFYNKEKFPDEIMKLTGTGNMSGYHIAGVIFSPIIYYPSKDEIDFIEEVEYRVIYTEKETRTIFDSQRETFKSVVGKLVVNPEMLGLYSPKVISRKDNVIDLVIVTNSTFAPYLDTLKKYKERRGIKTEIVTLDYIYAHYTGRDNPEKIRNFIKDYYQNRGLRYVILGGQADHENGQAIVPRRDVFYVVSGAGYYDDEDTIPSDLYYSDLDGTWNADNDNVWGEVSDNVDMYPDVFVGRLPARNVEQLQNIISKIITYENNPPSGYLTNVVLPAQLLWSQYPYYGDSVNNRIANLTPTPPWNDIKLYQSQGNLNTTNFINAVSNGVGFAHYASHGSETSASFFNIGNINSMVNGNRLGIHNAICCFTGAIDEVSGGDCLAESLVNHRNGGAVATIMNTRYGWGYPPQLGPSEKIDSTFYFYVFQDSVWTLGHAHALSLARWVPTAVSEGTNGVYRWCIYELWIFGDPTLQFYSAEPSTINASYTNAISTGCTSLEINTDAPSAIIAVSKQGVLISRGRADLTGSTTLALPSDLIPGETLEVVVRAKNRLPHRGLVAVVASNEPYLGYRSSYIQELTGNGNGRINPGETIRLYVMLKNYGQDTASNVVATINTTNPHVSTTDNAANYGDILPGDSTYGLDYFEFTVDSLASDQEVIPFAITITATEGSWSASFNYTVYAPILSYMRLQVIDDQGNNNGIVDPGETVTLRVYSQNTGHEDAPEVLAKITCTDSRVTINSNNISMGNIPQNGSGYSDFSVTFGNDIGIGEIIAFGLRLSTSNLVFLDDFNVFVGVSYYTTSLEGSDYLAWSYESPWARRNDRAYDGTYSLGT
ncbi:MAG: C25 family cysteine peptidase, partial [Candidatus Hydrothermia bacterium]